MSGSSPWGKIDHVQKLCHGVSWVGTPSHGGLRISEGFAKSRLSEAALNIGTKQGSYYFWEEDCDYAVPFWELPIMWNAAHINKEGLYHAISRYNPRYFLDKGIEPDAAAYADFLAFEHEMRLRSEKCPDLIVAAMNNDSETVRVWTADGIEHLLSKVQHAKAGAQRPILLSNAKD